MSREREERITAAAPAPVPTRKGITGYRVGRVAETLLLLAAGAGILMFAWSIVDIVRIEAAAGASNATSEVLPPLAWPGVLLFFGAIVLLQPVRALMARVRADDGSFRGSATAGDEPDDVETGKSGR
jgi:hypothetical protein